jgi:hypothetical protein
VLLPFCVGACGCQDWILMRMFGLLELAALVRQRGAPKAKVA